MQKIVQSIIPRIRKIFKIQHLNTVKDHQRKYTYGGDTDISYLFAKLNKNLPPYYIPLVYFDTQKGICKKYEQGEGLCFSRDLVLLAVK